MTNRAVKDSPAPRVAEPQIHRRWPIGAEVIGDGVHFRVWAPGRESVSLVLDDRAQTEVELNPEGNGYFSVWTPEARAGTRYRFRLDGESTAYPDPASRFQPEGPHGPSQVIDPTTFRWTDRAWGGLELAGQVLYEMHIGTFTPEGTWAAAGRELDELADIGISVLEILPIADFPGRFGWGYDGVNFFAPSRLYGTPDDFREFVDRAHALGIAVILDVVYNHFGPAGNYLYNFSPAYRADTDDGEWGDTFNFDGEQSGPVREFVLTNSGYWIDEFHLDGLRLDATQAIHDTSPVYIINQITEQVRRTAGGRKTIVIGEDETQRARLIRPPQEGGSGLDGLWNDDFHHTARIAGGRRREAYYTDYLGTPQEFVSSARHGFLYQGQWYSWQKQPRGSATHGISPHAFVHYLQNHDQVANSATGARLHEQTTPGFYRTITAVLLLGPATPLLFQGQEFCATSPFLYFAEHEPELARAIRTGRAKFLSQFPSIDERVQARLPDPSDPETFERSKLIPSERRAHVEAVALHRDLIRLRRAHRFYSEPGVGHVDGAVLPEKAFLLRFGIGDMDDRLLVVNFGQAARLTPMPEPLLAPPAGTRWRALWSSDDRRYGGKGQEGGETPQGWVLPGETAIFFAPDAAPSRRLPDAGRPSRKEGEG